MTKYTVYLIGEDHTHFTKEVEASCRDLARMHIEEMYPEARLDGIYSPDDIREIEQRRYRALEAEYDNDGYYGDDYYD